VVRKVIAVTGASDFVFDGRHLKGTYRGASTSRRKVLDWKRSRISIFDVEAVPQSWMP
jgi:hypothetical protein